MGLEKKLIKLIISYLSNRKHYTKIKDTKSNQVTTTCGVPQVSLGGPKFFTALIYVVKFILVSIYKFVDDNTLVYSFTGDCTFSLQSVLDIKAAETKENKIVLNESNCSATTFNFSANNSVP